MTWVLFDYGGVICTPQPDSDVARLASAAGVPVPAFRDAYWAHRLDYDRGELDGTTYWQKVAAGAGGSFSAAQVAELTRLDIASWLHLRPGTVTLIEDLAAAGYRLALLSNAPAEVAVVMADLPVAAHFEHCVQLLPPVGQAGAGVLPGRAGHARRNAGRGRLHRRPAGQRGRGTGTGHPRRALHRSTPGARRAGRVRRGHRPPRLNTGSNCARALRSIRGCATMKGFTPRAAISWP